MFEFRMPDIGEGVVEGEVVKWHVKAGDTVREDQPMVEVMTDKATVEIPSPKAGIVKEIRAAEGKTCAVGSVMVVIEETGDSAKPAAATGAAPSPQAKEERQFLDKTPKSEPASVSAGASNVISMPRAGGAGVGGAGGGGKVLATPATRKLARDLGVDLAHVRATGPNGRVTHDDVRAAGNGGATAHAANAGSAAVARAYAPMTTHSDAADERIPFRGVRKKIAENMHRSRQTAAHFTYVEECDMTELVALRKRAKARAEERGLKLSFLPFIVKAVCAGLKKFPIVNSTLDEQKGEIVLRKRYHVGVAAATAEGLIVPVVKDADQKSLFEIARTLDELSEKSRSGKATRDDLTGSTFTISSLGTLGGVLATPIINFPEVAILGVHKIKPTPVVRDGQIVVREMMNLSISLDHRVVDGYEGAQFLQHIVELLQDPTLMFMEMV
ncbi:MAG: catalytic domain of component of various dehydrogenase complexe [Myxococcales bacterium]|nr:catalytic domain of component of various dehydrogenase complexe [Myxococcales bacterium]